MPPQNGSSVLSKRSRNNADLGGGGVEDVDTEDAVDAAGAGSTAPSRTGGMVRAAAAPVGTAPAGTASAGTAPVGRTPAGMRPAGTASAGAAPVGRTPAGMSPAGTASAGAAPVGKAHEGPTPVELAVDDAADVDSEDSDGVDDSPSLPLPKRRRVEQETHGFVRRPCATFRASRKPQQPRRFTGDCQEQNAVIARPVRYGIESFPKNDERSSYIQKLVRHVIVVEDRKARRRAQRRARRQEAARCKSLLQAKGRQDCAKVKSHPLQQSEEPSGVRQTKKHAPPTPPLLACIKREAAATQHQDDETAALLEASKGLLCMKTAPPAMPSARENRMKSLNALHAAEDDEMDVYCPAPGLGLPAVRKKWDWAYDGPLTVNDDPPTWGCRMKRSRDPHHAQHADWLNVAKEKDAKLQRQENAIKERDKTIASLTAQMMTERTQVNNRIAKMEAELTKQRQTEREHFTELKRYKADCQSQRDSMKNMHARLVQMQEEIIEVHRSKAKKELLLEEVQQELARARMDVQASKMFRQELLKVQAEALQHQKEADKQAAAVLSLQRTNQEYVQKIDALLLKVADMAEQVQEAAALTERSHTMQNILNAITSKAEQLRASGIPADLDAFHALRNMVSESATVQEEGAASGSRKKKLIDLLTASGHKKKNSVDMKTSSANPGQSALSDQKRLDLLEKENDLLVARCKQQSERVRDLEQEIATASRANTLTAVPWKARVAGGNAGDYHTFAMRTSAQVELPEGTLLSVPRSANMQSSSNGLLSLFHDGDILNFLNIDLNSLSPADREAAGQLLLEMNMSQLTQADLGMLMRKLGKANLAQAKTADVQFLATQLLNVLGIHGAMALLEDMVNHGSGGASDPTPSPGGPQPPQESDDTLTYYPTSRHNPAPSPLYSLNPAHTPTISNTHREVLRSPVSEMDPSQHAQHTSSHPAAFMGPASTMDNDPGKPHASATTQGAPQRHTSPFSAPQQDFQAKVQNSGAKSSAYLKPALSPHLTTASAAKTTVPWPPSSRTLNTGHLLGNGSRPNSGGLIPDMNVASGISLSPGMQKGDARLATSPPSLRLSSSYGAAPREGSPPREGASRSARASIQLEHLNSITQLRNLPVAVLQGLTQQLAARGRSIRKPQ